MRLLDFSRCEGRPSKIPIDTGSEAERTLDIVCTASPAGAKCDMQVTIFGNAQFEKPVLGSALPLEPRVVPPDGEIKRTVTLKSTGPGPFATITVVLTEVPATPGALVSAPQTQQAIITIRTK